MKYHYRKIRSHGFPPVYFLAVEKIDHSGSPNGSHDSHTDKGNQDNSKGKSCKTIVDTSIHDDVVVLEGIWSEFVFVVKDIVDSVSEEDEIS